MSRTPRRLRTVVASSCLVIACLAGCTTSPTDPPPSSPPTGTISEATTSSASAEDQWVEDSKKAWACFLATRNRLRKVPSTPDASAQFKKCTNDPLLYKSEQELKTFTSQGFTVTGKTVSTVTGAAVTIADPPTVKLTVCLDDSSFGLTNSSGSPVSVSGSLRGIAIATVQRYNTAAGKVFLVHDLVDAPGKPPC